MNTVDTAKPVGIGIIGCGGISDAYFTACPRFPNLKLVACADLDLERAKAKAVKYSCVAMTVADLLADPGIDLVVNLTIPAAHVELDLRALRAGKHVYSEKPFALSREDGRRVLAEANARNLRVACGPDTNPLGGAVQTARGLIDGGTIGKAIATHGYMMMGGHESWHAAPEFYYQRGGGPLLDMGPYYLHTMITLLGPVARVAGLARTTWPVRTITSEPKKGKQIPVEVATHLTSLLDFASGCAGTLVTSFDIRTGYTAPFLEILGSEGSIQITHNGKLKLSLPADKGGWQDVAFTHPYTPDLRGVGVADLGMAIRSGRAHRATGEFALHVLDIMLGVEESSRSGRFIDITCPCDRPAPMAKRPDYDLDP